MLHASHGILWTEQGGSTAGWAMSVVSQSAPVCTQLYLSETYACHRIPEWLRLAGTSGGHLVQPPLLKQGGHLEPVDQGCYYILC